jgi:predicted nucleic acid-binding protein
MFMQLEGIQEHIRSGRFELVWSYTLDFENAANPFEERRTTIRGWRQYATMDIEETPMILQSASLLVGIGLRAKDALHVACAIAGECKYLATTDDRILNRRQDIHDIVVIDPTAFVREMNL